MKIRYWNILWNDINDWWLFLFLMLTDARWCYSTNPSRISSFFLSSVFLLPFFFLIILPLFLSFILFLYCLLPVFLAIFLSSFLSCFSFFLCYLSLSFFLCYLFLSFFLSFMLFLSAPFFPSSYYSSLPFINLFFLFLSCLLPFFHAFLFFTLFFLSCFSFFCAFLSFMLFFPLLSQNRTSFLFKMHNNACIDSEITWVLL